MNVFDEIGSEYWKADIIEKEIKPIDKAVYLASGRSAQSLIVESLQVERKVALLPAYTCQHIVEPFSWKGWQVEFYDINRDLTPNLESFQDKLKENPSCIIVEGYYGFPTANSLYELLKEIQKEGTVIIEDITHSFLNDSPMIYKEADYAFCSLRKWSGLSDGGFALSLKGKNLPSPCAFMKQFSYERHIAREIKACYADSMDCRLKELYLSLYAHSEELIDSDIGIYSMSKQAYDDYLHLDFEMIKEKRIENFSFLLNNIQSKYVKPIFSALPDGIVPIMFPIYIPEYRTEIRQLLIENRIYCPVHWPMPIQLDKGSVTRNEWIYNSIMSIPCDQRYEKNDMERLVNVLNGFIAEGDETL